MSEQAVCYGIRFTGGAIEPGGEKESFIWSDVQGRAYNWPTKREAAAAAARAFQDHFAHLEHYEVLTLNPEDVG